MVNQPHDGGRTRHVEVDAEAIDGERLACVIGIVVYVRHRVLGTGDAL
jgi:hypothetical protein